MNLFTKLATTLALITFLTGFMFMIFGVITPDGFWKYWGVGMCLYVSSIIPWLWEED